MRSSGVRDRDLPGGEVCFLFTDVEASTVILRAVGDDEWARLQSGMHAIVRYAVESHGGSLVNTEGDGCFAAFPTAIGGVQACAAAQRVLSRIRWGDDHPVLVRMGLHVGTDVHPVDDDYVALAVHRTARVAAAAHGGQVLATAAVVERCPPGDLFTDLGLFSVRDFDEPVQLFGLTEPGTATSRPKVPYAFVHELPRYRSALVGREHEIDEVLSRLRSGTAVTLTGAPGIGKTRLAVAVLSQLATSASIGPWFVDLSAATDIAGVWDLVARAVGCASSPLDVHLDALLDDRAAVLVLDGCAHLAAEVSTVVQLLVDWTPTLQILTTAGAPLGLPIDIAVPVPPLDLPETAEPGDVLRSGAGRLFVERLRPADGPDTELTPELAGTVHELCAAIGGVPLAIELVAGRCLAATPADVLAALPQPTTTAALIESCVDALPATQRQALRALALATQPVARQLAGAALGAAGIAPDDVDATLAALVRRGLLDADPHGGHHQSESVRDAALSSVEPDFRHRVLTALLDTCLAVTAQDPVPLARHEPVADTAAALIGENALPVPARQQLATQLAPWWSGRLGTRRARDHLTTALGLGREGRATAALHLAIAATYEPGQETVDTEHHVREAARLLGEQDAVDPAIVARIQATTMREVAQPPE